MTKVVKKKKIKWIPFLFAMTSFVVVSFAVYLFLQIKTQNVLIKGNELVSEIDIFSLSGLSDYPSFFLTTSMSIKRRLKANPLIKDVQVKRKFFHQFVLEIEEETVLYQKEENGKYVLENGEEISLDDGVALSVPKLVNYVPNNKIKSFLKGLKNIKKDLRERVSEMTYVPNEYEKILNVKLL